MSLVAVRREMLRSPNPRETAIKLQWKLYSWFPWEWYHCWDVYILFCFTVKHATHVQAPLLIRRAGLWAGQTPSWFLWTYWTKSAGENWGKRAGCTIWTHMCRRFKRSNSSSLSYLSCVSQLRAFQRVYLIFTSAANIEALKIRPAPARFQPRWHHFPVRTGITQLSARHAFSDWLSVGAAYISLMQ